MQTYSPKGSLRGFIMPDFIFKDRRLSLGAKTLYALFCNYAGECDHCWPSHATLAKKLGCSISSIKTYVEQLIRYGFILSKNTGTHFRSCMYFLLAPINLIKSAQINVASQNLATFQPLSSQNLANRKPNSDYNLNLNESGKEPPLSPNDNSATQKVVVAPNNYKGGYFASMNKEFEQFWNIYPRKDAKELARALWCSMYRNSKLPHLKALLDAVHNSTLSNNSWQKENGRYIPMCVNWLKGKRWTDEFFESVALKSAVDIDEKTKITQQIKKFTEQQQLENRKESIKLEAIRPLYDDFASLFKNGVNKMAFATWAYLHGKGILLNKDDVPCDADTISLSSWLLDKKRIVQCQ